MKSTRVIKSICVYCGSSSGRLEAYSITARTLAKALVDRNIRLVYGGASVGIMGLVADTVLQLGGQAVGVIPEALVRKEIAHKNLTALYVTPSMHERKSNDDGSRRRKPERPPARPAYFFNQPTQETNHPWTRSR